MKSIIDKQIVDKQIEIFFMRFQGEERPGGTGERMGAKARGAHRQVRLAQRRAVPRQKLRAQTQAVTCAGLRDQPAWCATATTPRSSKWNGQPQARMVGHTVALVAL